MVVLVETVKAVVVDIGIDIAVDTVAVQVVAGAEAGTDTAFVGCSLRKMLSLRMRVQKWWQWMVLSTFQVPRRPPSRELCRLQEQEGQAVVRCWTWFDSEGPGNFWTQKLESRSKFTKTGPQEKQKTSSTWFLE